MTIFICPRCQARLMANNHNTDYVHDCNENPEASKAQKEEDVIVYGSWNDYTGSATKNPQEKQFEGLKNTVFGTRAWVEGEHVPERSDRGASKNTNRQRRHLEYIKDTKQAGER